MPATRPATAALLFLAVLLATPSASHACSFSPMQSHPLDPEEQALDTEPPASPTVAPDGLAIRRGTGPTCRGFFCESTSCDDLGWITIALTPGADDRTSPEEQGFALDFVGGTLPDGLTSPSIDAVRLIDDEALRLVWIDDADNVQEAFDFEVDVVPTDLAGNEGEPLRLRLADPGSDGSGCSIADPVGGGAGAWAMVVFLVALGRRRPRNQSCFHSMVFRSMPSLTIS